MTEQTLKGRRKSRRVKSQEVVSRDGPQPEIIEVRLFLDTRRSNSSVGVLLHEMLRSAGRRFGALCVNLQIGNRDYDWRDISEMDQHYPLHGQHIEPAVLDVKKKGGRTSKPPARRKAKEQATV